MASIRPTFKEIVEGQVNDIIKKTKIRSKRCYYCREQGHIMRDCHQKELDDANWLIHKAIETGTQDQTVKEKDPYDEEYIVTGTDTGTWKDMWHVNTLFKHHIAGNMEVFKRIHRSLGVETRTVESNILFIKGIGMVDIINDEDQHLRVNSVFYCPDLDRNVLSLHQLILQGFDVRLEGHKCTIRPMFEDINPTNYFVINETEEEEILAKEKQKLSEHEKEFEDYKEGYLNAYFEHLDEDDEVTWITAALESIRFKDLDSCVRFLDLLSDHEYVAKFKVILREKFDELIAWFLRDFLKISDDRPIPPPVDEYKFVSLFDLYLIVKREGGHRVITVNNMWSLVAHELGLAWEDGLFARLNYLMYLDVMEYHYKIYKAQEHMMGLDRKVQEGETSGVNATATDEGDKLIGKEKGDTSTTKDGEIEKSKESSEGDVALFSNVVNVCSCPDCKSERETRGDDMNKQDGATREDDNESWIKKRSRNENKLISRRCSKL